MKLKHLTIAALLLVVAATVSLAQCAMCKANIANAENAAEVSQRMNSAVLVLLVPTILIIGGIARLVFKYRDHYHEPYVNVRSSDSQRRSE